LLLIFPLASVLAAVPGDRPGDYSHTIALTLSGDQAVVQLPLPRAVYLASHAVDLRDLRVFDASGASMPFSLVAQPQGAQERRSSAAVSIFPVRGAAGSTRLPEGLEIRTGDNGAVISVQAPAKREAGDVLVSLVLDMHGSAVASAPVTALSLSLPAGMDSYTADVALDISDDLQRWEEVADASISWLVNKQGASVGKNRIAFAPRTFRFARLRWIEGTPVEFATVSAEFVTQQRAPERWESLVLQPTPASAGEDLVYQSPIAVPVQEIGLELQGRNVVMPVEIGHYQRPRARQGDGKATVRLQSVARTTFYQLTQGGQNRVSGDIEVPLTHSSEWVVRPQASITERPGLRLRWKPASIVFVAGGRQPYTLAFGLAGARSSQVPLGQVAPGFSVRELATLEQAAAGEVVRQRPGDDQASGGAQGRVTWLWALLVLGVAALGLMVWTLTRQMKEAPTAQPPT
jgi:hypothetical protein